MQTNAKLSRHGAHRLLQAKNGGSFAGLALAIGSLAACGAPLSESEREQRESLAFNLEGTYQELSSPSRDTSPVQDTSAQVQSDGVAVLRIVNEFSNNDVVVDLSLNKELDPQLFASTRNALIAEASFSATEADLAIESLREPLGSIRLGEGRQ